MKVLLSALLLSLFLSCGAGTVVYLRADYKTFPEEDRSLLAPLLDAETLKSLGMALTDTEAPGTVTLAYETLLGGWEASETAFGYDSAGGFLALSRTCMVPRAEVREGKAGVSLDECSRLPLIPLSDLSPPYTALKVDGLDVSDPGYPLVARGGIRFSYVGKEGAAERPRRIRKKIDALAGFIRRGLIKTDELIEAHGLIETDGLIGADGGAAGARFEERPRLYRIAAGGDAMLARGVGKILFTEGAAAVLGETAALVGGADLSIVNLEGVLSDRGEEAEKTYTFRFDPRTAAVLKDAGFDAVLLANNHAFDFGLTGFLDSLDHLEKAGLAVLGAGRERAAAAAPFITGEASFPVRVFGIASFGPERNGWDGGAFAADVNKPGMLHAAGGGAELIKSLLSGDGPAGSDGAPLDIVFFHGGVEYADYPDGATRALYTELINAGADLVIGTHPHVEQGFEWVRGKPVFWSLGDYIFDEMDDTPGGDKGIFVVLSYPLPARPGRGAKRPAYIEVYPLFMKGPRTLISPEKQLDRFLILTRELAKNEVQL